jgi:hypothetical protein
MSWGGLAISGAIVLAAVAYYAGERPYAMSVIGLAVCVLYLYLLL